MFARHLLLMTALALPLAAAAQSGAPSKLSGDKPIEINADALEVLQQENRAIFTGRVVAIQGDVRLKADKMVVFYRNSSDGDQQQESIQKIEVEGNVFLATPSETASGTSGIYHVDSKEIRLNNNVVLTREKNTLKGDRLVYNMATGKSVITTGGVATEQGKNSGQRVRALFVPDKNKDKQND